MWWGTKRWRTFVFEKVAHSRTTSQNQLGDILDNLGFVLGREGGEPFGQALEGLGVSC